MFFLDLSYKRKRKYWDSKFFIGGMFSSETCAIEDCIRYDSTVYQTPNNYVQWSLPSSFKVEFTLWSNSDANYNVCYIRFNNSSGLYCGKGSSTSRNVSIGTTTLGTLPTSTDTTYTLSYNGTTATLTDGTNTKSVSASLTSLYEVNANRNGNGVVKNIKIKPL